MVKEIYYWLMVYERVSVELLVGERGFGFFVVGACWIIMSEKLEVSNVR